MYIYIYIHICKYIYMARWRVSGPAGMGSVGCGVGEGASWDPRLHYRLLTLCPAAY